MPAETDVVNVALRLVGSKRIQSLTEDSVPANVARDIYTDLVEDLLRQHFWNFATKRAKLAQVSDVPTFEFDHAYAAPSDWLRTVSVHTDTNAHSTIFYREEIIDNKRVIVTSVDEVYMRYIALITDPNLWAADFRRAVSTALARDLAIPLANSNTLLQLLATRANFDLARARSVDAMGSSPERRPRGSWVTRRGTTRPLVGDTTSE